MLLWQLYLYPGGRDAKVRLDIYFDPAIPLIIDLCFLAGMHANSIWSRGV